MKVQLFFILFFVSFICVALPIDESTPPDKSCETLLKVPESYWILPTNSQVLAIGVLAETEDGAQILAVADYYWGLHEVIFHKLQQKYTIKRLLWAGELLIANGEDHPAPSSILFSINTSGFLTNRITNAGGGTLDINSAREFEISLRRYRPDLISRYSQYFVFDRTHAHLDPFFQELHRRAVFSEGDTVRHRFNNILGVMYAISHIMTRTSAEVSPQDVQMLDRYSPDTLNDIIRVIESQTRYSRSQVGIARWTEQIKSLFRLRSNPQRGPGDVMELIDFIKTVSPRVEPSQIEPEVITIKPAGES